MMNLNLRCFLICFFWWMILLGKSSVQLLAQEMAEMETHMDIGVSTIDITPDHPIRLAGYGAREKKPSEGIIHQLNAKALAFGRDDQGPSILITVDLVGIPAIITAKVTKRITEQTGIEASHLVICASHTHGGPEVGNLLNILQYRGDTFSDSLLKLEELVEISRYTERLTDQLVAVALSSLADREPALLFWGQGRMGFAKNRRTEGGPVDQSFPLMKITDPTGNLKAILVNYACHGTTLGGDVNQIHGDWMGEAQLMIESNHPGVVAMVAIGCGADANPYPRGKMEHLRLHAHEVADNVEQLLTSKLHPIIQPPSGKIKWINLPFAHVPSVPELIAQTEDKTVRGYYARLALDRIARGQDIPKTLSYPVQTWTFGNEMAMVNLAGEVVVDYSLRLKKEIGADKLWINAYANDVPCYIASCRVIREGGYESESSMYYYDKPSPFAEGIEELIINTVHELLPPSF
ncbi:hypothetical protein [Cyclobacterium sp.]|uniref:hypothetical protein n=1 Tax=Cyclobacterium sp. TaxID=1966343 RepID=UPI0019C06EBA|nr:hypothetical protein [Cyclobacterium sp.]MBD3627285.1 hypothetical protein [Cyclobacterium sp.]